jgi:hypothetical protein
LKTDGARCTGSSSRKVLSTLAKGLYMGHLDRLRV